MPNWVRNRMTVKFEKDTFKATGNGMQILNFIMKPLCTEECVFDFEKLIPIPDSYYADYDPSKTLYPSSALSERLSESSRMTIIKGMARRTGMTGAANTGAQSGTRVMLRELSERIVWKSFLTPHGQRRQVSGSDYSSIWIICSRSDIPE